MGLTLDTPAEGEREIFVLFKACLEHALRNEVYHGISYPVSMPLQGLSRLAVSEKNKPLIAEVGRPRAEDLFWGKGRSAG
jgi:hypothetical protein